MTSPARGEGVPPADDGGILPKDPALERPDRPLRAPGPAERRRRRLEAATSGQLVRPDRPLRAPGAAQRRQQRLERVESGQVVDPDWPRQELGASERRRQRLEGGLSPAGPPTNSVADRRSRRARGSLAGLAIWSYITLILNLVTAPLLARGLGPTGRGQVAAVSVWDRITTRLFAFGLPEAAAYESFSGRYSRPAILGTVARLAATTLPLSVGLALAAIYGPLHHFSLSVRICAAIMVGLSPVATYGLANRTLVMADGALGQLSVITVVPTLTTAVVVVPLWVTHRMTVSWVLVSIIVGNYLTHAYCVARVGYGPRGKIPARPMLGYGARAMPGSLATYANNQLDQALIGPLLGLRQLGFYAVAVGISSVPLALAQALASRAFGAVGQRTGQLQRDAAARACRETLVAAIVATAVVGVGAPIGLPLIYGHRYNRSLFPLFLLLPGTVAFAFGLVATWCLNAMGEPGKTTRSQSVALVVTVVGLAVTLRPFGIAGAAAVSTAAYLVRAALYVVYLRRLDVEPLMPRWDDVKTLSMMAIRRSRRMVTRRRRP